MIVGQGWSSPDIGRKSVNCTSCGTTLLPGAAFCGNCGTPVPQQRPAAGAAKTAGAAYGSWTEPTPQLGDPTGVLTCGDLTIKIEGELVPVVDVELGGRETVYFEHHILLWKQPQVQIGVRSVKGAVKRMFAGLQIFVTEARGRGNIAFSREAPGQIVSLYLQAGQEVHVREHQFLLASGAVDYGFFRVKGIANILLGGSGFFMDTFRGTTSDGILLLHGYGNVFTKTLAPGESVDVEPGAFLWKDATVQMDTTLTNLSTGLFGGASFTLNRFTGPGRLGMQSMTYHPPAPDNQQGSGGGGFNINLG